MLQIKQDLNVGLGAVVWDCGLILGKVIEKFLSFDKFLDERSVLDMGCGTGLCGLLASFCGASRVVLTDVKAIVNVAQERFIYVR